MPQLRSPLLQMLAVKLGQRTRYPAHDLLDPLHEHRPRVARPVVHARLVRRLPNVVHHHGGHHAVEVRQAAPDDGLGQRPEAGPRETKGDGAEGHGLALVVADAARVAAPPRTFVDDGEPVGHIANDVEQLLYSLAPNSIDACCGLILASR